MMDLHNVLRISTGPECSDVSILGQLGLHNITSSPRIT